MVFFGYTEAFLTGISNQTIHFSRTTTCQYFQLKLNYKKKKKTKSIKNYTIGYYQSHTEIRWICLNLCVHEVELSLLLLLITGKSLIIS